MVFLEGEQPLGTFKARLGEKSTLLEFGDLVVPRIRQRGLWTGLPRRLPELPSIPLPPPTGEVRRVDPFAPHERVH